MSNVKNVVVGAAQLFVSRGYNELRPATYLKDPYGAVTSAAPAVGWSDTQSARGWLLGTTGQRWWRDVGYTNNGLEISYEPSYGDVVVDQLLDAARLFKQSVRVTLKTELAEATLENMALAFGQPDPELVFSNNTGSIVAASVLQLPSASTSASVGYSNSARLGLAAGSLGDQPVERSIVAIGQAPEQFGTNIRTSAPGYFDPLNTVSGSAALAILGNAASANVSASSGSLSFGAAENTAYGSLRERVYVARRVVQMDPSMHALKRDGAVSFPVMFRCLPDDNDIYDGAEYGIVVDRIYSQL